MKRILDVNSCNEKNRSGRLSRLSGRLLPLLCLGCLLLLAGCASSPSNISVLDDSSEFETLPMTALEGYRGDNHFHVKYQLGGRIYYSGGNWNERVELVEQPVSKVSDYAVPGLVPMQYRQLEPWQALPGDAVEIPVFGADQWQLLRDRLLRSVVPTDGTGVVVDFGHAEYFLYNDRGGKLWVSRLQDKPSNYRVQSVLKFDEFMRRGRPVLQQYLLEQGITANEFVFNTGDTGWYSLPFLYVNTELKLLVFIRNVPLEPVAITRMAGVRKSQAFGHLMRSHLSNLLLRPVSSLYRLFFVVTDTAVATVRFDWATGLADKPVPPLTDKPSMDLEEWELELDRVASRPQTRGDVELLVDGDEFFPRFIDSLTIARESVRLQTYIFDNDDYAVKIGELLKRRSNEGVDVKILLDGFGTIAGTMSDSESLPEFHAPPPSVRGFLESDSNIKLRQKTNPWFTGDHVKSIVVDQEVAFVGGMNIGREYRYDWHDLMMELRGPVVDKLAREFDISWSHAGLLGDLGFLVGHARSFEQRNHERGFPLRILLTGPGNYEIYDAQLRAIRRAQRYIYIQNAYFTDDRMLRELVLARRRGVDVRVVVPMETDHGPITRSNVLAVNVMLDNGIRVYIYPGFSHVKAAIYDGWACLGSANFDRFSLRLNRELNIASSDPALAEQLLERLFEPDFLVSPELTERIPKRWVDHLVEIVGDYLY